MVYLDNRKYKNLMLIEQIYVRIGVLEVWEDSRGHRYASIRNRTYESIHPVGDSYTLGRRNDLG